MKILSMVAFSVFACVSCMPVTQNKPPATTEISPNAASAAAQPAIALSSPPAAQTADSIAIIWEKPRDIGVESYDVYAENNFVATTRNTDYTLCGLVAAREFEIFVRAHLKAGNILQSNTVGISTKPEPAVFDVTKYGAIGDGKTLNTIAIQAAIDACGSSGDVRIPAGKFLTGAIFLKSEMTLHLDEGAVLLGSPDTKDYPLMKYRFEGRESTCYASLVNTRPTNATRWRNITIDGAGTVDATGSILRKKELKEAFGKTGRAVCIRDTDNVYLQGITVRQSPSWCVHLIYCNRASVNCVNINTRSDEAGKNYTGIVNGDGLDPDSCRDVSIFNCNIATEDDCISLKSGRDAEGRAVGIPTQNVRISNCRFTSGFGVAMGSEMAGGLRNVLVEDCSFQNTHSLASIKAIRGRGNSIENITYRDCTYTNKDATLRDSRWSRGVLYVDQFYGDAKFDPQKARPRDESTPLIRNILFQNITLDTISGNAIYLTGLPESPLENIRLENVTATGEHGFIANNVRGIVLDHVSVDARDGNTMRFLNVR
jgi:exo-poly-alpha-galacturonosidase